MNVNNVRLNEYADDGSPAIVRISNFLRDVGAATHTEVTGACAVEWHRGYDTLHELIKSNLVEKDTSARPYVYMWIGE